MIPSVFDNLSRAFQASQEKLVRVVEAASDQDFKKDLASAFVEARIVEVEVKAQTQVAKRTDKMEKDLLDILA